MNAEQRDAIIEAALNGTIVPLVESLIATEREDAERYRWLCDHAWVDLPSGPPICGRHQLDAAIDRARSTPIDPVRTFLESKEHICGLSGYNGMIDPPCPACARSTPTAEEGKGM